MKKHDLPYNSKARQIKPDDFKKFDYIFGMDTDNMEDLVSLKPKDGTAKLLMLGEFDPQGDKIIRDPYYVSFFYNELIINFTNSSIFYRTKIQKDLKSVLCNVQDVVMPS